MPRKLKSRKEFEIGWRLDSVPKNASFAQRMGCTELAPEGLCCLVLDEASKTVKAGNGERGGPFWVFDPQMRTCQRTAGHKSLSVAGWLSLEGGVVLRIVVVRLRVDRWPPLWSRQLR